MHTQLVQMLAIKKPPQGIPWRRVLRVMIAVGLPLAIALFRGEFLPAVYGAVAGFYTMFVDNGGNTSERITVMMYMTVGMLLAGIAGVAGHYVQGAPLAFLLAFAIFTGWLQGAGNSVEMMSKYWLIAFLFGDSAPHLSPLAGTYLLIGGMSGIFAVLLDRCLFRAPEQKNGPMLYEAMSRILRRPHNNSIFAFYFAAKVLLAYLIGYGLGLERAYWVPLTVVLVTVYDNKLTIDRMVQRLFGSVIGALLGWAMLYFFKAEWQLAAMVVVLAAITPVFLERNYWLAVIPITALVMVLLDFGGEHHSLVRARVENTIIACVLSGMGTLLFIRLQPHYFDPRPKKKLKRIQSDEPL
ncbi:FUSC family protein [Iodobacter sp.]|uniref:FUSC family protein n=1 Tax=Iodobacter sp. TaxID=1915058 RepID=UPI0025DEAD6B|nr:FUSC family protein [Iodobacter sp.]